MSLGCWTTTVHFRRSATSAAFLWRLRCSAWAHRTVPLLECFKIFLACAKQISEVILILLWFMLNSARYRTVKFCTQDKLAKYCFGRCCHRKTMGRIETEALSNEWPLFCPVPKFSVFIVLPQHKMNSREIKTNDGLKSPPRLIPFWISIFWYLSVIIIFLATGVTTALLKITGKFVRKLKSKTRFSAQKEWLIVSMQNRIQNSGGRDSHCIWGSWCRTVTSFLLDTDLSCLFASGRLNFGPFSDALLLERLIKFMNRFFVDYNALIFAFDVLSWKYEYILLVLAGSWLMVSLPDLLII